MDKNRLKSAFNLRENLRDIFHREEGRYLLVDGIRAFSILYVVVFHALIAIIIGFKDQFLDFVQATPWYFQWVLMGDRGVDSFFVISGFLIGQILFKEQMRTGSINLKRFFVRRWMRLTPAYYFIILMFAIFAGPSVVEKIAETNAIDIADAWKQFIGHMFAFTFYLNNFLDFKNNHIHFAWSLAIEEQFYIVFALFLAYGFYKIKNRLTFLCLVFLSSFLVRLVFFLFHPELLVTGDQLIAGPPHLAEPYWEIIYDNLYTRYGSVMCGVILAYLYVHYWDDVEQWMTPSRSNMLVILALFLTVSMSVLPVFRGGEIPLWMHYVFHVGHRNLFSLSVALIILCAMFPFGAGGWIGKALSSKIFYPVSQLSYSMYLIHLPVLIICCLLLRWAGLIEGLSYTNLFIVVGVSLLPMMFVSGLIYVFIEKPFMNLRR